MNNSVVFRLNYLLGVNKTILEKEFPVEFKESEKLKLFENYPDARKVRSISRLRQSVLSDFAVYQRKAQDITAFNGVVGISEDISYLKNNGIDVKKYFKELSLFRYFNLLSRMLNAILFKVLVELEIPYVDELIKYFYMPTVSKSELENLVSKSGDNNNPYKIIIYNGDKIRQSLKYALHKDRNCIYSIYSIQGKSFSGDIKIEPFVFAKEMCEDIDPESVIDIESMYKEVKAEMVTPNMKPMKINGLEEYQKQQEEKREEEENRIDDVVEDIIENENKVEKEEVIQEQVDNVVEEVQKKEIDNEKLMDSVEILSETDNQVSQSIAAVIEEVTAVHDEKITVTAEDFVPKIEQPNTVENVEITKEKDFEDTEVLEIQIDKTMKVSMTHFSVEQILQESRFDALTYSVLCSIIKMPLYKIVNEKFVKSRIMEAIKATQLFSDEDIKEYFANILCDLKIEITENVVTLNLGNYTVYIG